MDLSKEDLTGQRQEALIDIYKKVSVGTKGKIDLIRDFEEKKTPGIISTLSYNPSSHGSLDALWVNFNDHFNAVTISARVSEEELKSEEKQKEIQMAMERENLLRSLGIVKLREPSLNQSDPRLIKIGTPAAEISYIAAPNNSNIYLVRTVTGRNTPGEVKMTESFVYIPFGRQVDVYIVHDLLKNQGISQT